MTRTWAPAAAACYGWEEGMTSLKAVAAERGQESAKEVADSLNAERISRPVSVPSRAAFSILLKTGDWGRLKLFSRKMPTDNDAENALIAAAITAVDAVEHTDALGTEEAEDAAVITAMMAAFVSAGLMQATTVDRLSAMMTRSFPVWDPAVTVEDVEIARKLTDG